MMDRLPPGQIVTRKWPVLQYSQVPLIDTTSWRFQISGLVEQPLTPTWQELARFTSRARGAGPVAGTPSLFLEECEVGDGV